MSAFFFKATCCYVDAHSQKVSFTMTVGFQCCSSPEELTACASGSELTPGSTIGFKKCQKALKVAGYSLRFGDNVEKSVGMFKLVSANRLLS